MLLPLCQQDRLDPILTELLISLVEASKAKVGVLETYVLSPVTGNRWERPLC